MLAKDKIHRFWSSGIKMFYGELRSANCGGIIGIRKPITSKLEIIVLETLNRLYIFQDMQENNGFRFRSMEQSCPLSLFWTESRNMRNFLEAARQVTINHVSDHEYMPSSQRRCCVARTFWQVYMGPHDLKPSNPKTKANLKKLCISQIRTCVFA